MRYVAFVDLAIGSDSSNDDVVQQFAVGLYDQEQSRFIQFAMSDDFDFDPKVEVHSLTMDFRAHPFTVAAHEILKRADCVIVYDLHVAEHWLKVGDPFYPGRPNIPWYEAKNLIDAAVVESMDCMDCMDVIFSMSYKINETSMSNLFAGQRVAYARKNMDWETHEVEEPYRSLEGVSWQIEI